MADIVRNPKQLGNVIQRARKRRDLSQTQLGEKADIRQRAVSLIETGNSSARLDTILSLLAALDLELRIAPRTKGTSADIEDIF